MCGCSSFSKEEPEVFVFDNNGTDGTETMMLEWQRQNKRIYYHRSDSNLGATGGSAAP